MSDIIIYGFPLSTYVRAARIILIEKGVPYTLEDIGLGSPAHRALNPLGRIPVMRHGDLVLFETFAIARYVDESFDGPALQPADPATRAIMTQWVSATIDSVYPTLIRRYLMTYVRAQLDGVEPDRAVIDASLPDVEEILGFLDNATADREWLAGSKPSFADFILLPIIFYMYGAAESGEMLPRFPNLRAWYDRASARPSAIETVPPPLV